MDKNIKKGFMLVEVMIAVIMAGILAAVLGTIGYYTVMQGNTLKTQNTKTMLEVIRSRLVSLATNPDSDAYFELLKEDGNNTVPVAAGLGKDAWGRNIFYSTYDFGLPNDCNNSYTCNTVKITPNSPSDNVIGRLISSGENGILETNSSFSTSQGDDLMIEIGIGETNHLKLYGGSEITTQTRGYNSAIISTGGTFPSTPINGTIVYFKDTNETYVYDIDTNWTRIN